MDAPFRAKLKRLGTLCESILGKGGSFTRLRNPIHELRPLSDAVGYLAESDTIDTVRDPPWQQFWQQFQNSLGDCEATLEELLKTIDAAALTHVEDDLVFHEVEELIRPTIQPYVKTINIAIQLMATSRESGHHVAASLRILMGEITHTADYLQTKFDIEPLQRSGSISIFRNLSASLDMAEEWVSYKLGQFPTSSGVPSTSTSITRQSLKIERRDSGTDVASPEKELLRSGKIVRPFPRHLPLGAPSLDQKVMKYRLDLAVKHVRDGNYPKAKTMLQNLLREFEENEQFKSEVQDDALKLLATVYCEQREFAEADKLVQERDFRGKESIMSRLIRTYCRRHNWEQVENLVNKPFEGRDALLKALATEFCTGGRWNETEKLLNFEFEGRDSIRQVLGLAYCENQMWEKVEAILTRAEFQGKEGVMEKLAAGYYNVGKVEPAERLVYELLERGFIKNETLMILFQVASDHLARGAVHQAEDVCCTILRGTEMTPLEGALYQRSVALLIRIYQAQGAEDKVEFYQDLLPGYRELERLSHLDPETAAIEALALIKDRMPNLSNEDTTAIISNIERSKQGVLVHEYGFSLLHAFAKLGHEGLVQVLLDKGASPNGRDDRNGSTPLIYAAGEGRTKIVEILLNAGADIESQMKDGSTSLIWATCNQREEVIQLLLARGAATEATDSEDCTALIYAASYGDQKTVSLLLEHGAKPCARGKNRYTALIMAASKGHESVVRTLLEKGADVDAKDHLDNTALIWAAWKGHGSVVKVLLQHGANAGLESAIRKFGVGRRMRAIDFAPKGNDEIKMALKGAQSRYPGPMR